jgi:hypothetical protein
MRASDYRKLAPGIAFGAMLLAALAGASHWHHDAKAAVASPPGTASASPARGAHSSFKLDPRTFAISPSSKRTLSPGVAAGLSGRSEDAKAFLRAPKSIPLLFRSSLYQTCSNSPVNRGYLRLVELISLAFGRCVYLLGGRSGKHAKFKTGGAAPAKESDL